jgi:hypothetical protein
VVSRFQVGVGELVEPAVVWLTEVQADLEKDLIFQEF